MMTWILAPLVGGTIGFLLGRTRSCTTGGCPLTSNPWVGMLYGAFLGFLFAAAGASGQ
jgi:hypothetical protein